MIIRRTSRLCTRIVYFVLTDPQSHILFSFSFTSHQGTTAITMAPGFISSTTKIVDYSTGYTPSSMEDIDLEDAEIATPIILASHTSSPIPLKGAKNNIMMGASPVPHPLSLSMDNNSFHRFQSDNSLYTHSNSALIHAALGPVSSSSPSCYSTSTVPSSATAAFMAMHGHNTSLYEPSRRNSVPTLTADQAEHKRKTCSEEKTLQRQASWTCFHTSSPISGLHQAEATHVDPTAMYRSQLQQQNGQQSSHSLSQVMPGSTNSSACPSPMPESFMPGSVLSNLNSSSTDDESPVSESGGAKVKRNNSICSTTSVSSTGSGSSNKHPCRFASCGWSFKRYEHLKRHMLVHSKERSFVCDVTGCNKSFSRSDNFSAHLRTHSKKSSDYRRRSSRVPDSTSSSNDIVQQEDLDIHLDSSASSLDQHNSESGFGSGSMSQEPSESGRDSSPARSPIGTPLKEDETFGMLGSSGYPFGNTMYSMDPMDPMDPLSGMVPRFDTIRLDLKSVAPSDIHRQSYADDQHSQVLLSAGNPNVESPHPSPIPHYEQFTFPSSISTHFMPIMHGGFPLDPTSLQQQHQQHQQQNQIQQSPMHIPSPSSSYSPMPSADSSSSSAATLHPGYPMEHDLRSLQFANVAGLHFAATSPLNEDGPIPTFHPHSPFQTHTHLDFYDTKVATPQMLHHTFPQLHSPSPAALPPHPLMPTATFSAPGLNEPLYSNPPMSSSTPTSLVAPRGKEQLLSSTPNHVAFMSSPSFFCFPLPRTLRFLLLIMISDHCQPPIHFNRGLKLPPLLQRREKQKRQMQSFNIILPPYYRLRFHTSMLDELLPRLQ